MGVKAGTIYFVNVYQRRQRWEGPQTESVSSIVGVIKDCEQSLLLMLHYI